MTTQATPTIRQFTRSGDAQRRLHDLVPGGAHTYARGPDQYPEHMAPVLVEGRAAHVYDLDGNEFVEYGMGLRAVTLGHAHPAVNRAVAEAISRGVSFTRPTTLELQAAESLVEQVPGADMVKFAKNGSDATSAAVRLARAATGRSEVAICGSQPFFSTDDWFIGTTPMPAGTLGAEHVHGFDYNDLGSLEALLDRLAGQVACVFLEAATVVEPGPGFLAGVRELADRHGCVLVFDEMITGMRWAFGGAQSAYDVIPDLSTWGKGLGNGFAVAALAGRRDLMELGGLRTDADRVFLLSTTNGPEAAGLAAYLAVAGEYRTWDVVGTLERQGARLAEGVRAAIAEAGLEDFVTLKGRPSNLVFTTAGPDGRPSQEFRTLFLQGLLEHGVLGQSLVISAAHTEDDIATTVAAVAAALAPYGRALEAGSVAGFLHGRPVAPALRARAEPRRLH